jgi:hypothetical protein
MFLNPFRSFMCKSSPLSGQHDGRILQRQDLKLNVQPQSLTLNCLGLAGAKVLTFHQSPSHSRPRVGRFDWGDYRRCSRTEWLGTASETGDPAVSRRKGSDSGGLRQELVLTKLYATNPIWTAAGLHPRPDIPTTTCPAAIENVTWYGGLISGA